MNDRHARLAAAWEEAQDKDAHAAYEILTRALLRDREEHEMGQFIIQHEREHEHEPLPDRELVGLGSVWQCDCGVTWQLVANVPGAIRKWTLESELNLAPPGFHDISDDIDDYMVVNPHGTGFDDYDLRQVVSYARAWHAEQTRRLDAEWERSGRESSPVYEDVVDVVWEDAHVWLRRIIEAYDRSRGDA